MNETRIDINSSIIFNVVSSISIQKNICWIFDDKVKYQVLLSLGSIIKNNPKQKFNFFFILPPNMTIDLSPFNKLIKYGSQIFVKHYEEDHAFFGIHSRMKCKWSGIIIVKLWLYKILPELDKILYLDTDIIDIAPISQLWNLDLNNKTFAGVTKFEVERNFWINSGVILYNLKELRKKSKSLWTCADRFTCFIDDEWHTTCHSRETIFDLPLRYNIEMKYFKMQAVTNLHEMEKDKICLVHLKDDSQEFYFINKKDDISKMKAVEENPYAIKIMEKLYDIKEEIDHIVHL